MKDFFAALNSQVDRTLATAYRNEVGQLSQATTNLYGMSLGDPRIGEAAAKRNSLMNSARTARRRREVLGLECRLRSHDQSNGGEPGAAARSMAARYPEVVITG